MRRIYTLGFVMLLFVSLPRNLSSAGQAGGGFSDRDQILDIERQFADSAVSNDVSELQDIFADDYIGTEPDGKRVTKADSIAEAKSGPSEFASCRLNEDEVKIRFYGDVAVVNGTESWKKKDGKSGRFIWTDVIVKQQNKWRVVSSQDLAVYNGK